MIEFVVAGSSPCQALAAGCIMAHGCYRTSTRNPRLDVSVCVCVGGGHNAFEASAAAGC